MCQVIENINKDFPSPNVPIHCFWVVGVDTPWSFNCKKPFPEGAKEDPEIIMGDEDDSMAVPSSDCLLYTSPSPRDATLSRMPSSA